MLRVVITAAAVSFAMPAVAQQPILADARQSAKFVTPGKVRIARYSSNCGPRAEVEKILSGKYAENSVWESASSKGHISELWQGDKTWSITITMSDNTTCVMDSGELRRGARG